MSDRDVLVVDAGSHSLELALITASDERRASRSVDGAPDGREARAALDEFIAEVDEVAAVGHRLVHGGPRVIAATMIDRATMADLRQAQSLAPLHLPPALAAIELARERLPGVPHVAAVDTAFHAGMPAVARTYALPSEWRDRYGLRRYGFHGLSYAHTLRRAGELLRRDVEAMSLVLAHLGGGASVCAVREGHSVWTSMGMTPLEGLVMGTRSGSIDPGLVLRLISQHGLSPEEVRDGIERRSGLLGLSGGASADTRELVRLSGEGDATAAQALDSFAFRAAQEVAAATASLERLDAVVFTGEIGADQPEVREAICARLGALGVSPELDAVIDCDGVVSRPGAAVAVMVVTVGEDLQVARETRRVIGG